MALISQGLLREIRRQFRLDWHGIHGAPHWARVRFHGVSLARALSVDVRIPVYFAVLHDSQRMDDGSDPEHGSRAAEYATWLRGRGHIELEDGAFGLLRQACIGHSNGLMEADLQVQVCWDADRLDLGRVDVYPDARRLCTVPARDPAYIDKAWRWSRRGRKGRQVVG